MPDYTIAINTDTNDREEGLQRAVDQHNAANPEAPAIDAKQYLQAVFDPVVDSYAQQFRAEKSTVLKEKFERADQATKDQVTALLTSFQPKR